MSDQSHWQRLWAALRELRDGPAPSLVLIGRLAVWLHASAHGDEPLPEPSHDGEAMIALDDFIDLRDHYETVYSARGDKHQLIRHGVPIDLYVEGHHRLPVTYAAAAAQAVTIDGFRVATPDHLITLKRAAAAERSGNKGEPDRLDLERLRRLDDPQRDRPADRAEVPPSTPDAAEASLPIRIPPPRPVGGFALADGQAVSLDGLCYTAGLEPQVSGGFFPAIRIVDGDNLEYGNNREGRWVYRIGEALLAPCASPEQRAWWVLAYLAYGFHDYRARETLTRAHNNS